MKRLDLQIRADYSNILLDPVIQSAYQINGVVTVVDSYHIHKHFEKGLEAKEQIAFADVVLVNKLDLIEESEKENLLHEIQGINPTAKLIGGD